MLIKILCLNLMNFYWVWELIFNILQYFTEWRKLKALQRKCLAWVLYTKVPRLILVYIRAKWHIRPSVISTVLIFGSKKQLGIFLFPPTPPPPLRWDDSSLHLVTPSIIFAGNHLYTWVERGIVSVTCLTQEHNTMSLTRVPTNLDHSIQGREH